MPQSATTPSHLASTRLAEHIHRHETVLVTDVAGKPLFDTTILAERARQRPDGQLMVKGQLHRVHQASHLTQHTLFMAFCIALAPGDMTLVRERRPLPVWARPEADYRAAA